MIKDNQEELVRLESRAMKITKQIKPVVVKGGKSSDNVGDAVSSIVDTEEEIKNLIKTMQRKKRKIKSQIEGMNDFRHYQVLSKRYLYFYSFDEIAYKLEYSVSWVKKTHQKALEEFEKQYAKSIK
jgi:DNA-directed RNA polymerase specialized sigma subunit